MSVTRCGGSYNPTCCQAHTHTSHVPLSAERSSSLRAQARLTQLVGAGSAQPLSAELTDYWLLEVRVLPIPERQPAEVVGTFGAAPCRALSGVGCKLFSGDMQHLHQAAPVSSPAACPG